MSDAAGREWRFYLDDMIDFTGKALAYTAGLDRAGFSSDSLRRDATLRNLELLGEAATHIPQDIRNQWAQIPWRQLIATRNRLIHAYLGIDDDVIWSIVCDDLLPLREQLTALRSAIS
jgi:uncharacterized protein with HEPN domain